MPAPLTEPPVLLTKEMAQAWINDDRCKWPRGMTSFVDAIRCLAYGATVVVPAQPAPDAAAQGWETSVVPIGCSYNSFVDRVCERGTQGCTVDHERQYQPAPVAEPLPDEVRKAIDWLECDHCVAVYGETNLSKWIRTLITHIRRTHNGRTP